MGLIHTVPPLPMTPDETAFFREPGARIAQRRKALEMTQAQLGEWIGVTQQQIASFETGRRRMPISLLPLLGKALGTSIEQKPGQRPF